MSYQLKCNQCFLVFTAKRLPRRLQCGHNICHPCYKDIETTYDRLIFCEFCQKAIANKEELPFNEEVRLAVGEDDCEGSTPSPNAREHQVSLLDDQPFYQTKAEAAQICQEHQVVMDIICTTDKRKICPHCALFGDHKKHSFKRIDDFQEELREKCLLFGQIQVEKGNVQLKYLKEDARVDLVEKAGQRKMELLRQVDETVEKYRQILSVHHKKLIQQIEDYFAEVGRGLETSAALGGFQESRGRFDSWQKRCEVDIQKLQHTETIEEKVNLYFNEPLEIVSEGYIYLEELNKNHQILVNTVSQLVNIKLASVNIQQTLDKTLKLSLPKINQKQEKPTEQEAKEMIIEEEQMNPFMDCTSSQIGIDGKSLIHNNVSIQDQISSLTSSVKFIGGKVLTNKLQEKQISTAKNITGAKDVKDKGFSSPQLKKYSLAASKTLVKEGRNRQTSLLRSQKKMTKTMLIRPAVLQPQPQQFDMKQTDKRLADFMKSTLTDFLDLSDCNLPNDKIIQSISRAKRHHKIKGLKLSSNQMDVNGFQKLLELVKGVANINLANNQINAGGLELIVKNKDKFDMLRVINLSHNSIVMDKKSRGRVEEIRKMGIIVTI